MSVIAHWIEEGGISTVVIGLVKEHLAKIKPPRALWVPFELGRPMGAPRDPALQRRVLIAALEMVTVEHSVSRIIEFSEEDPRAVSDPGWQPPVIGEFESVCDEVQALSPARDKFLADNKRTAAGVAKMDITECALLLDQLKNNEPSRSPYDDVSPMLLARYAIDDLKAFYIESALADGSPSSRQIYDWFWRQTHLGYELQLLRQHWMKSENEKLKKLGELFIIPHRWRQV